MHSKVHVLTGLLDASSIKLICCLFRKHIPDVHSQMTSSITSPSCTVGRGDTRRAPREIETAVCTSGAVKCVRQQKEAADPQTQG